MDIVPGLDAGGAGGVGAGLGQSDAVPGVHSEMAEDVVMDRAHMEEAAIQSESEFESYSARVQKRKTRAELRLMERRRIKEQWEIQRRETRLKVIREQSGAGPIFPGGHWSPGGHGTSLEAMFSLD